MCSECIGDLGQCIEAAEVTVVVAAAAAVVVAAEVVVAGAGRSHACSQSCYRS